VKGLAARVSKPVISVTTMVWTAATDTVQFGVISSPAAAFFTYTPAVAAPTFSFLPTRVDPAGSAVKVELIRKPA
jgi:ABC-type multidrug transport system permease subunit